LFVLKRKQPERMLIISPEAQLKQIHRNSRQVKH
jgi:hypothetical protein